tara:strand:+ start:129 stop:1856 length:1728 start_codon:yes stop_codon:yes gene_type:complete
MIKIIKIAKQISKNSRSGLYLFFFFTTIATILEIFSIGIILPLIQSLMNGNENFSLIIKETKYFELPTTNVFYIFVFLFIIKNIYLVFYYWWISKFTWNIYSISSKYLLKKYLSNSFVFFKKNEASQLVQNVFIETKNFTATFSSLLIIIFESFVLVSIVFLLFSIEFKITMLTLFIFFIIMLAYHKLFSKTFNKWGSQRRESSTQALKTLNEIFSGIKTIKIFNVEKTFNKMFANYINRFSSVVTKQSAFANYPKIVLEMSAITIIFSSLIIINNSNLDLESIIPFFGVFIAGAFRLLPSVNKLMMSFNNISFHKTSINMMIKEYDKSEITIDKTIYKNIIFEKEIKIEDLSFSHNQKDVIYDKENITINKFDFIGIYGESGSGKTTLVDIIIGLYKPNKGKLIVDGKEISTSEEIQGWQKKIAYVPQSTFLFNGSIENNVSFEFNKDLIDTKKVVQSLESSQLEKFVNEKEKFNYIIDEGGGNLSVGEKQRIGIARALYKNPELIILDEPTSALDSDTAKNLIKFFGEFRKRRTLIIISHDLNTLQFCNKIYEIKQSEKGGNKIILKDSLNLN